MDLSGAVAVVTGGANGIGRATAIALAQEGARRVVIADVDVQAGRALADELGEVSRFVEVDVGRREDLERLAADVAGTDDRCDLVISNAAIAGQGAPHEFTVDDWDTMIRVDLMASIWLMRAFLPDMLHRRSGHLSFVSSGAGLQGAADAAPYSVAKWGLIGLGESLAMYLRGTGVSTSVIVPGGVGDDTRVSWRTMRIVGTPEEREVIREEARRVGRTWAPPAQMAGDIVEGLKNDRFYIFQRGTGEHEDWALRSMRQKWSDPDSFVLK